MQPQQPSNTHVVWLHRPPCWTALPAVCQCHELEADCGPYMLFARGTLYGTPLCPPDTACGVVGDVYCIMQHHVIDVLLLDGNHPQQTSSKRQ